MTEISQKNMAARERLGVENAVAMAPQPRTAAVVETAKPLTSYAYGGDKIGASMAGLHNEA